MEETQSHGGISGQPGPQSRSILFVCTGNTCRSPLAESLCKKMLAERLGVKIADLPARGFHVRSAGVLAVVGEPASGEADEVAQEYGVDLSEHRSRPLDQQLLQEATDVIAMTSTHAMLIAMRFPQVGPEPVLLCGREDLPDPIGGDREIYRACASIITRALEFHLHKWLTK